MGVNLKTKIWGISSILSSFIVWIWIVVALPAFSVFQSLESQAARKVIFIVISFLCLVNIVSGSLLVKRPSTSPR